MKRLTKRLNDGKELCIDVCGEKCVDGYTWCPKCKPFSDVMKKLAEYEDLEEQEKLIILPCKIGRKVFYVQKCLAPSCKECKGFLRVDNCYCQYKARIFEQKFDYRHLQAFGKSVFLTKEEAEQALARMEKENG